MAVKFQFVTAFLCEKVLQEQDGTLSAIRIVDVFQIPEKTLSESAIQFVAVVALKTLPALEKDVHVRVFLVGPSGRREQLKELPEGPHRLMAFRGDPSVPTGLN